MPRKTAKPKRATPYSFRVPPDVHAVLKAEKAKGTKISKLIVRALRNHLGIKEP